MGLVLNVGLQNSAYEKELQKEEENKNKIYEIYKKEEYL